MQVVFHINLTQNEKAQSDIFPVCVYFFSIYFQSSANIRLVGSARSASRRSSNFMKKSTAQSLDTQNWPFFCFSLTISLAVVTMHIDYNLRKR